MADSASDLRSFREIELGGGLDAASEAAKERDSLILEAPSAGRGGSRMRRACALLLECRRPLLLALAVLLVLAGVAAAAYSTGRHNARLEVSGCAGLSPPSAVGDMVAPEGSIVASFGATHDYRGRPRSALAARDGLVAADHGRCSDIGASMLGAGGNAVDAAVATALCQGIANPMASGVGGGHFMLIRLPNGTAECIDAREVAPAAANETLYVGRPKEASVNGGLAVAVPLELRGMWLAHQRHGRLPWARLFEPAIKFAQQGFPAHPYLVAALSGENQTAALLKWPAVRDTFFIKQGGKWRAPRVNETCCRRPQLAAVLRDVADAGPDVLYSGKYAAGLVADIQAAGGVLTLADLTSAEATVRAPIRRRIWGLEWLAVPPPSSGMAVLAALQILAGYEQPLASSGSLGIHRTVEALKHAFALRMSMGDPGPDSNHPFVDLSTILSALNSSDFIDSLRSGTSDYTTLAPEAYGGLFNLSSGMHPEDHGTSHLSVVDGDGMAVSMTTTINTAFGSKVLSPSTGILLNNQMDDFSTPGQPNIYGIAPSAANFIRPGKKPFSSMSPLIAERNGQLALVLGASGGPRIISAVMQAAVRLLGYGEDLFSAVANPRLHHQLVPNTLALEDWSAGGVSFTYDARMAKLLAARGHQVNTTSWGAVTQAIAYDADAGALRGVSDPRKDGAPAAPG